MNKYFVSGTATDERNGNRTDFRIIHRTDFDMNTEEGFLVVEEEIRDVMNEANKSFSVIMNWKKLSA